LVRNFVNASEWLAGHLEETTALQVDHPDKLHISLSYLCCLTDQESQWANQYIQEWIVEHFPQDLSLRYDSLECVSPRADAAGVLMVLDENSQRQLMALNHDLSMWLESKGIPVVISREAQMKFHTTLVGWHVGNGTKDDHNAEPVTILDDSDLEQIYQVIQMVSEHYGDQWAGSDRMHLTQWPRIGGPK